MTCSHRDRKSTRLNSSHLVISYAVFCLKKEEHTSELQSPCNLVCRLLLEKKTDTLSVFAISFLNATWSSEIVICLLRFVFFFFLKERAPHHHSPFSLPRRLPL